MKSLRNPKRRPTHPGAILREDILPALKMTQTELAELLGVSRLSVSELLHEKRALSPEMAVRIGKLLNTSAESWLHMQEAVDLWAVQQETSKLVGVKPLPKARLRAYSISNRQSEKSAG
jgi:addiction module HigA family antidote